MKKKMTPIPSDDFEKNLNRALRFLSIRQRSEKEIKEYLLKKKVSELTLEKIIEKLKEFKFLNDEEFAKSWVETRNLIKPKPWRIIKYELKQKGISQDIIDNIGPDKETEEINDLKAAVKIAQKRLLRYNGFTREEIFQKLGRYLISKGFDWDIAKRSIDEVLPK